MDQGKKGTSGLRILVLLVVGAILAALIYYAPPFFIKEEQSSVPHLKLGGTSNVSMIMENRWRTAYRKEKGVEIDYDSSGSTHGIKDMIDKKYAIGFTHAPMTDEQKQEARSKGGEVVQIPVVLCAVVPVYNVKELKDRPPLKFTGKVLGDIFLGKIDRWNHPALKELNKREELGVDLPDTKIVVVRREDSSGTTFIFADYLYGASPAWQQEVGKPKNELKWPEGTVGKERNYGVARHVEFTEGAIGYVDLLNVFHGELPHGAVENADKTAFVHAKAEAMTAAAQSLVANIPEDLTFSLTNKPGAGAYPICGAIWAVCYRNQPPEQQRQAVDFLRWVMHNGQGFAANMSYAPLPEELRSRAEQAVQTIQAAP
jgi:phosphate transport system substrate-binding protein